MFNLFKKSGGEITNETELLVNIFKSLPEKFSYISNQLEDGLIVKIINANEPVLNFRKVSYNVKILKRYEDKNGRYFRIKGIKVFDIKLKSYVEIIIHIGYGILLGYYTPSVKKFMPDISKVDAGNFVVEYFPNADNDVLGEFLDPNDLRLINPADVYEVELNGKVFYHLKDLQDGDFIGVDTDKKIYKITHDPFTIIEIDGKLSDVI